jgi:hypothetical protein
MSFERLPEDIIRVIWEYDGRYIKAMKDSFAFIVSSTFRNYITYVYRDDSLEYLRELNDWIRENSYVPYCNEIRIRANKYQERMDLSGHIKGITDKYKKPIKRFTFRDCLGDYAIVCNAKHHRRNEIMVDGMLYQSVEIYPVVEPLYNRVKRILNIKEKCGIEVLDITWRRNARRRKEAAAYIKQHMSL